MFCDSFAVQPPSVKLQRGGRMGLSLWPVSDVPLRSSLRSLSTDQLMETSNLAKICVLAVFSYLPQEKDSALKETFAFPIEEFRAAFHPEGFTQPINLGIEKGFCFVLAGKESSVISRARCISFVQIVKLREIFGEKVVRSQPIFELFPCLSKFSLRFPLTPPPLADTSFIPFTYTYQKFEKHETHPCVLQGGQAEKWRQHITKVTDAIFISASCVANNDAILKHHKITHIVNCTAHLESSAPNCIAKNLCMGANDESLLSIIFSTAVFIDDAVTNKGKVLICCADGRSYSPVVAIAYLILKEKTAYDELYKRVKQKRRVINISSKFKTELVRLSELVGATKTEAKSSLISFEVMARGRIIRANPYDGPPPRRNVDKCFVTIDYSTSGFLSKRDNLPPGIINFNIGPGCQKELKAYAARFADDLARCLRVTNTAGDAIVSTRIYASPNWREILPESFKVANSETVYVIVDGIAWRMIVGADVPEDTNLEQQMRLCCKAIGTAPPLVYDVIDLADE